MTDSYKMAAAALAPKKAGKVEAKVEAVVEMPAPEVAKPSGGRPALNGTAMTKTERQRRWRAKKRAAQNDCS